MADEDPGFLTASAARWSGSASSILSSSRSPPPATSPGASAATGPRPSPTRWRSSSTARPAATATSACPTRCGRRCRSSSATSSPRAARTRAGPPSASSRGPRRPPARDRATPARSAPRCAPHGDRPHLPQLRRLPRRQRPHRPRRPQLIIAGMPSNTVDLSAFQGFLAAAAVDERFSPDRFLTKIDAMGLELDLVNRFALKFVGIGMVRERLLAIVDRFDDFVHAEPTFGPGRFDTFNPAKALLNWDFEAIPEARAHRRRRLPLRLPAGPEGGDAAALGRQQHQGLRAQPLRRLRHRRHAPDPRPRLAARMEDWLATAEPPRFPDVFPGQFDPALAAEGAPIYARECAACHGATGPRLHRRIRRQGHPDRRDRHRPRPARQLHPRPRRRPERALRRLRRRTLPDLPQDRRLRQRPARRPLAARPLPAQRLGPDARGAALAARRAPARLPARLRRLRPARDGLRLRPRPHRPGAASAPLLLHHAPPPRPTARPARRR